MPYDKISTQLSADPYPARIEVIDRDNKSRDTRRFRLFRRVIHCGWRRVPHQLHHARVPWYSHHRDRHRNKREKDKDGDQYFRPVITFKDTAGKEIAVTSNLSSNPAAYAKGDTVPLVYKRDQPEKADLETFFGMWGPASMFLIAGIIVGLLGLFVMIIRRRSSKPLAAPPTRPQ
jgi:hypothetical protein